MGVNCRKEFAPFSFKKRSRIGRALLSREAYRKSQKSCSLSKNVGKTYTLKMLIRNREISEIFLNSQPEPAVSIRTVTVREF